MKLDDLVAQDTIADSNLDDEIVGALGAFGFTSASGTLFQHPTKGWVYTISATRKDGSSLTWIGVGKTPEDAIEEAVDAVAKWILNQPIP